MRPLTRTAGRGPLPLLGDRDPAQPLLTLLDGPARVELSGATAANWAAKTANLLSATGGSAGSRVGLLLPLHWQAVTLLLGALAAGAVARVVQGPDELSDCDVAFCEASQAAAALDACAGDVYGVSCAPLGGRLQHLPALVLDAGAELPAYGDVLAAPAPADWRVECGTRSWSSAPDRGVQPGDRVLTTLPPDDPEGLEVLLAALATGAALVLVPSGTGGPGPEELARLAAVERVTASAGAELPGVRRLL